jgi:hypothetical protein
MSLNPLSLFSGLDRLVSLNGSGCAVDGAVKVHCDICWLGCCCLGLGCCGAAFALLEFGDGSDALDEVGAGLVLFCDAFEKCDRHFSPQIILGEVFAQFDGGFFAAVPEVFEI